MSKTFNVLAMCGSLRKASSNMGLVRHAKANAPEGIKVEVADLHDLPFYNQDIQGLPVPVQRLLDQVKRADGILLATPEYNYSWAPALKNALDWISRVDGNAHLKGKTTGLMGAGGGMGTSRSQYHVRQSLVFLEMIPTNRPEVFSNAFTNFDSKTGDLTDERIKGLVIELLKSMKKQHDQLSK